MPKNIMVKYVGPKKVMNVPFPEDGTFPLESLSNLHEIVQFPRGQGVELIPERAEVLLKQSPESFKVWGPPIKAVTVRGPKVEETHGTRDQNPVREDQEPADDHAGDGAGV